MKRKLTIVMVTLALLVFGALMWTVFRSPFKGEPTFQNDPLSVWLERLDKFQAHGQPISVSEDPRRAIRKMGADAVPALMRMLRSHDSRFKVFLMGIAQRQRLVKVHYVPEVTRHLRAVRALQILEPVAGDALPELIVINERGLHPFPQSELQRLLGMMGPQANGAVPALLRRATNKNEDSMVRFEAIMALGGIHSEPEKVVPALTNILADTSSSFHDAAITALGRFGPDAKAAVPLLVGIIESNRPPVPAPSFNYVASPQGLSIRIGVSGQPALYQSAVTSLRRIDPQTAAKIAGDNPEPPW